MDTPINLKKCLHNGVIVLNTDKNELFASQLSKTDLVNNITNQGGKLNLSVDDPHTTLPRIVEFGLSTGIYIKSISIVEPNMEDVFIHYTGKEIREDDVRFTGISAKKRRKIR
jgi:ABC-2 type transport system ATP-binding protein